MGWIGPVPCLVEVTGWTQFLVWLQGWSGLKLHRLLFGFVMRDELRMNWIWSPSWSHYRTKNDIFNSKCFSPCGVGRGHGGGIGGWWQGLDHDINNVVGRRGRGRSAPEDRPVWESDKWRTHRCRRTHISLISNKLQIQVDSTHYQLMYTHKETSWDASIYFVYLLIAPIKLFIGLCWKIKITKSCKKDFLYFLKF